MTEPKTIPAGYWEDAVGNLVPVSKIKDVDKERTRVVTQLIAGAKKASGDLVSFKAFAMTMVQAFMDQSLAQYDVQQGGKKGNVTLMSFDGRYKVIRQIGESLVFDERLQAAKALIDECIQAWSKGSSDNIKVLVNDAFQVDKQNKINVERVLRLRSLEITDEKWQLAMQAIGDSITVASVKPYIRFYERDEDTGGYRPISLDVAGL